MSFFRAIACWEHKIIVYFVYSREYCQKENEKSEESLFLCSREQAKIARNFNIQ